MTKLVKYFILYSIVLFTFSCRQTSGDEKMIMVTIEPQRYFAEQLAGSLFKIITMVPAGTSPETYDPSPVQMANVSESSAYFRIGHIGFETQWMDKIRENNPGLPVYDTSTGVEWISSEEHPHDHGAEGKHPHAGIDPHIWSSPKEALLIVRNMCNALIALDSAHTEVYQKNLQTLETEIEKTDRTLTELFSQSPVKSFIIYHPALSYLARDYGLTQYCIEFDGKEPSPAQMQKLIESVEKTNTKVVFIQQEFDKKNAEIIARETGCKLVVIDPLSYQWSEELIRIANAIAHE